MLDLVRRTWRVSPPPRPDRRASSASTSSRPSDGEGCTGRGACGSGRCRCPAIRTARPGRRSRRSRHCPRGRPAPVLVAPAAHLLRDSTAVDASAESRRSARLRAVPRSAVRAQLLAVDEEAGARGRPRPRRRPWRASPTRPRRATGRPRRRAPRRAPTGSVGGGPTSSSRSRHSSTSSCPGGESNSSSYTSIVQSLYSRTQPSSVTESGSPEAASGVDDSPVQPLAATTSASATAAAAVHTTAVAGSRPMPSPAARSRCRRVRR